MDHHDLRDDAGAILDRHQYGTANLELIGVGGQSLCYATDDVAVLITRPASPYRDDLTGHAIPSGSRSRAENDFRLLQWLASRAVEAGVRTPRILETGDEPRPYALIERARGISAASHPDVGRFAPTWFGRLGEEIRKTNRVETSGFGMFVLDGHGGYRGRFASWPAYLDAWLATHLGGGRSNPASQRAVEVFLAQGIITHRDIDTVVRKVTEARGWPARPVLTHYDNRLENLIVDGDHVMLLDWGLALSGIGVPQELIKLFEVAPTSLADPRVSAFLHRYGLADNECEQAIEDAKLMLVLDGLGMSFGWVDRPDRLDGVRAWLRTVKRICAGW